MTPVRRNKARPEGPPPSPGEYHLPLIGRRRETPSVQTFQFGIGGTGFRYRSNQFVFLELPGVQDPRGPRRPFSLSSSPTETEGISITSKMTGSPFKDRLGALEVGEVGIVRGPLGEFLLDTSRPAVMIAGGVGITPLRGMIRYAVDSDLPNPIVLLYSNKVPEEIVFRQELQAIAVGWGGLRVVHTLTRPQESTTSWSGSARACRTYTTARRSTSVWRDADPTARSSPPSPSPRP